jgi:hypothetical protein
MSRKSLIFVFLFVATFTNCISEKVWHSFVLGVGAIMIIDNFIQTVPEFCKQDKHKKLDPESGWMIVKIVISGSYIHRVINFWKKSYYDADFLMGMVNDLKAAKPDLFQ